MKDKRKEIIQLFKDGFDMPNGEIVLHNFPNWSFYPNKVYAHNTGINDIHSFQFNAIERRVIYKYLKQL